MYPCRTLLSTQCYRSACHSSCNATVQHAMIPFSLQSWYSVQVLSVEKLVLSYNYTIFSPWMFPRVLIDSSHYPTVWVGKWPLYRSIWDILVCTSSWELCLELWVDHQTHTSCAHVCLCIYKKHNNLPHIQSAGTSETLRADLRVPWCVPFFHTWSAVQLVWTTGYLLQEHKQYVTVYAKTRHLSGKTRHSIDCHAFWEFLEIA